MKHKAGFTLIELLVVIAIIGLLLAVIIPSFQLVKEQAKVIMCKNNLHQYGLAGHLYLDDHDDIYPSAWNSLFDSTPSGWCQWHDKANFLDSRPDLAGPLWPYLESRGVHLCPTFERVGLDYGAFHPAHDPTIPVEPQYSYSMNASLGQDWGVKKKSQVKRPVQCFFFAEENMWVTPGLNNFVLNDNALCVALDAITDPPGTPFPEGITTALVDSFGFFHNNRNLSLEAGPPGFEPPWSAIKDTLRGNAYAVFVDSHVQEVLPTDSYMFFVPK